MTVRHFQIQRRPGGYTVVDEGGRKVAGLTDLTRAEDALERLRREARIRVRPCLRCGAAFESEGSHNRMCNACRRLGDALPAEASVPRRNSAKQRG